MSVRPFAEQERELVGELCEVFALRARRDQELATQLADGLAALRDRHTAATQGARAALDAGLAALDAQARKAREDLERDGAGELDAATKAMNAELEAFHDQTRVLASGVTEKLEESKWLAETMYESGRRRVRAAYETARASIGQYRAEFDTIERQAGEFLRRGGFAPLPTTTAPGQADSGASPLRPTDLEPIAQAARDAALRLRRAARPLVSRPVLFLGTPSLAAGVGAALAQWGPLKVPASIPAIPAGAAIGLAIGLLVLLLIRTVARRQVPGAADALGLALINGRLAAGTALRAAAEARDAGIAGSEGTAYKEWSAAQASVAATQAQVRERNAKAVELRARHQQSIDQIRSRRAEALGALEKQVADRRGALETTFAAATREADDSLADDRRRLEEENRAAREALGEDSAARIATADGAIRALAHVALAVSPPWDSPVWEQAPAAHDTPAGVCFGHLRLDASTFPVPTDQRLAVPGPVVRSVPLFIDLRGQGSVLLRATPDTRGAAIGVLNNMVLRLLTGLPPGRVRFTMLDPVGLGQSFAGLMHLSDYEEAIVGERIWTDPRHIEQRLADLTEHMETVIQKYLRNEYPTIQAYNAEAGEVAEPYRFLVIADFPTGISEVAAKRLASVATSGARCGVFTLIMTTQPEKRRDAGARGAGPAEIIPWSEIERHSMVLRLSPSGAVWAQEPFSPWSVELEAPPGEAASTRLLHQIGEHVRDSTRVQVPFEIVEPPEGRLWSADATSEVRLPLGRAGAKKLQHLTLGQGTAQHALIAGRTGSGKSTLLHVIITTAALWYSPDQVELYLVDFKKGVEFKTYATHRLPHARVVAVESEREFGLSVLHRLDDELTRRGELFRHAGVQDLPAFRRWQARTQDGTPLARILLIVDEFQEFFVEDDKLAQDAALLLDRLVRQGRAFGLHVILGSQTLGGAYTLAKSTLGQMAVRIALQCSESDSYLIMNEENPAPRLLSRPGEAVYNDASGMVEANSPFQIVWLPDHARDARLQRLHEVAPPLVAPLLAAPLLVAPLPRAVSGGAPAASQSPRPQIVFEGNVPGDPTRSHPVNALMAGAAARPPLSTLWLGEPLAIKDPTGITLRHQSAANILIVGNQDEAGAAMTASAVLSLAAWLRCGTDLGGTALGGTALQSGVSLSPSDTAPSVCDSPDGPTPPITILDAAPPDQPHADLLARLAQALGPLARLAAPRSAKETLAELAAEIDRRDASGLTSHPPALVVIQGLQRFRDLRKSEDFSFSSDAQRTPSGSELLTRLLRAGPPVGVHTLLWCDTATNLERMLERSALRDFNSRVLMQMSAGDSTQLIETQQAAALGRHRAILYSDDTGTVEKFRPYATPPADWLAGLLRHLGTALPASRA